MWDVGEHDDDEVETKATEKLVHAAQRSSSAKTKVIMATVRSMELLSYYVVIGRASLVNNDGV